MLLKKYREGIVKGFIYDLTKDNIFLEHTKNPNVFKGFEANLNSGSKKYRFTVYAKNGHKLTYYIKYCLFRHANLESVAELYKIALEKLNNSDYNDKVDQINHSLGIHDIDFVLTRQYGE